MATKLEIILSAKNETNGAISEVKNALGGLAGAAKTTVAAAGASMLGAVTAVTGAIGIGSKKAGDLQQGVANIASVMGLATDEVKPLKDLIQQLGVDPHLQVDATGAASAIEMLAKNGLDMTAIMGGASRATVLLANATGGDFATSANVATDAMNLFGIKADDMSRAVDGITGVTVASKFGIEDYALALAQGGGVAAVAGVSFEDFNTTIAAISPYFASGSDAGTSFKTFLQRLVPQSDKAAETMSALGLITEAGKNQFFDAAGQMKSMADVAGILQSATAGLSEEQRTAQLSTIFGMDAIRAAAAIAENGAGGFNKLAQNIGKVSAESSAAVRMNTLAGKMEILQGIIDGLLTRIGDAFLPLLSDLADWAGEFVNKNGDGLVLWFEEIAKWLRDVTPRVTELAQRGFWLLSQAAGSLWPVLQTLAKYFIDILDGGTAWNGWLLQLPEWMIPVMRGLGELADIVRGLFLLFTEGDIKPLVDALGRAWYDITNTAKVAFAAISGYVRDNLPGWIDALGRWGAAALAWTLDIAPKVAKWVVDTFGAVIKFVADHWRSWADTLAMWGRAAWAWLSDVAPTVAKWVADVFNAVVRFVADHWQSWADTLATWAAAAWKWIAEDAGPKLIQAITDAFNAIVRFVSDNGPAWVSTLGKWALATWQWIVDVTPKLYDGVVRVFTSIWSWIVANWPTWTAALAAWAVAAWKWIAEDAGPKAWSAIVSTFTAIWTWVAERLPAWIDALSKWALATWQWIVDVATPVKRELDNLWVKTIKPWLDTNANGLGTAMEDWKEKLLRFTQEAKAGWDLAWPDMMQTLSDAADDIEEDGKRILESLNKIVGWFTGGENNDAVSNWRTFFEGIVGSAAVSVTGLFHVVANIVELVSKLGDLFGALKAADWGSAGEIARQIAGLFGDTVMTPLQVPWQMWQEFHPEGRAAGGSVLANQVYRVGERGPEWFVPETDGEVIPNGAGVATYNTFNVYISGSGSAGRDVMGTVQLLQALYG